MSWFQRFIHFDSVPGALAAIDGKTGCARVDGNGGGLAVEVHVAALLVRTTQRVEARVQCYLIVVSVPGVPSLSG